MQHNDCKNIFRFAVGGWTGQDLAGKKQGTWIVIETSTVSHWWSEYGDWGIFFTFIDHVEPIMSVIRSSLKFKVNKQSLQNEYSKENPKTRYMKENYFEP